jgi:DNA-binding transcriptional MerR regulator
MDGDGRTLISIGQLSLATELTTRALRLYDKLGILVPAHVDPDTGYRFYAVEQVEAARQIALLRRIDLPLDEIRDVLASPLSLTRSLEVHASTLRERRDDAERALELLHRIQRGIEPMNLPIEIREVEPTRGISIEMTTRIDEVGAAFVAAIPQLVGVLQADGAQGGSYFAAYPDEEFDPQDTTIVIGIATDADIAPRAGGIAIREFGGGRCIVSTLEGPYDGLAQAWREAWGWMAEHGHARRGPAYGLFRIGEAERANPADFVTDIVIPIAS